jgi:hypothetical protein
LGSVKFEDQPGPIGDNKSQTPNNKSQINSNLQYLNLKQDQQKIVCPFDCSNNDDLIVLSSR